MENKGTTNISASIPVDLWNTTVKLKDLNGVGISRYVQSALRYYNRIVRKRNIVEFVEILDDTEFNLLKEEIKKRSR